ncbi:sugar phosphate isomerase/epimerase family protein [Mangrovactinospora gilvigrisea]|uniref:sugar phosphate isomerase/epimerase family protein n=1 Tax=Mangrovactinospora gilvigrisea TaxID=1428644 RepID=UPI001C312707|nr:TIM barrel protein [Mangrovactinospora gilvigrisea]
MTFRELDVPTVVGLTADAGLRAVEWGGDVHVPVGDLAAAGRARALCAEKGVDVASYGSYWRAGDVAGFAAVVRTAAELGAPGIRVWAGEKGSAESSPVERAAVAAALAGGADLAAEHGITVSLEFHRNTLTDTLASARALLDEAAALRPGAELPLCSYWQPDWWTAPTGIGPADAVAELAALGERLTTVHVFSWATDGARLPLAEREELWRAVFRALHAEGAHAGGAPADGAHAGGAARGHYALMEFVAGGDAEVFRKDAATLLGWLEESVNQA